MKDTSKSQLGNISNQHFAEMDQKPIIKITFEDTLIMDIQEVIDEQLFIRVKQTLKPKIVIGDIVYQ